MKENKLKRMIQNGETAYGVLIQWPSPEMVEYCGHLGFDWTFIDAEHGYIGRETCAQMIRACDTTDMTALVRVPENNTATILGYLETGAMGVVIPHVSTAEAAKAAADAVRYAPRGIRGAGSSTRPANYGLTQTSTEYFSKANDEVLVYVMLEDEEGCANVEEILAVDGVDIVDFGPGDLAMSMGHPGNVGHPDVQKLIKETQAKIDAKKPAKMEVISAHELVRKAGLEFLATRG